MEEAVDIRLFRPHSSWIPRHIWCEPRNSYASWTLVFNTIAINKTSVLQDYLVEHDIDMTGGTEISLTEVETIALNQLALSGFLVFFQSWESGQGYIWRYL